MKEALIEIVEDNPFQNCLFERKKYSDILINLINNHPDGFVLSINNSWGTGKTTFIEMFRQSLINDNFETVLFNAWENDYDTDPLIAILGELKILSKKYENKEEIKKVVSNGTKLAITGLKAIVKHQIEKHAGKDVLEIYDAFLEGSKDIAEKEIEDYEDKKDNIKDFRESLIDYISSRENSKPIVFIIDELDRCRPDYGINFLENIKHLFNVPNIVFVLSIDKEQLGAAIKGFYGSDSINTDEYLKKIIDIELSLPYPNLRAYIRASIDSLKFKNASIIEPQMNNSEIVYQMSNSFKMFYENEKISPRKLNKIINHQKLIILSFNEYEYFHFYIISFIVYLKYQHPILYNGLIIKDENVFQKIIDILIVKLLKTQMHSVENNIFKFIYAYFLNYYGYNADVNHISKISYKLGNDESFFNELKGIINHLSVGMFTNNNQKNYYIDKIEFLSGN